MVLVPLCGNGTRGDQVDNAKFFEEKGAAFVLLGKDATDENLKNYLSKLLDEKVRQNMADASLKLSQNRRPAKTIAGLIFEQINK